MKRKIKNRMKNKITGKMKRFGIVCILVMGLLLTGCNNKFAKEQYDSDIQIAEGGDRYVKTNSVLNNYGNNVTYTIGKFDGRETLWEANCSSATWVDITLVFTLDEGKAKLVQIDEDGNVSTVVECTPDSEVNELTTYSIQLKEGKNRLKFVGYDCKNVTFYMEIKES